MRQMLREMAQWHARGLAEPLRARRPRARAVHAARPARRVGGPSFYARRRGGGRARARRPRPTRCSCTTCSARPTRRSGSRSSRRRSRATGWPTSATPRRRAAASRRGHAAVSAFVEDAAGDDRVAREQYFDLLVMRRFRSSLVCHADRAPAPRVDRAAVQRLLVALDGDEAPEAHPRGAGWTAPVPFADAARTARRPAADELAEALVAGASTPARSRSTVVPSPAAAGGRASGRGRAALARPGAAGGGGDDAAQPGRADHGRADGGVVGVARRDA